MTICWRENLSVGHRGIDSDHKQIIQLINDYEMAIRQKSITELKFVFKNLLSYSESHFKREEDLMFKSSYPLANDHVQLHDKLKGELQDFHDLLLSERKFNLEQATAFLKRWLVDHIITEDLKFKAFMDEIKAGPDLYKNNISRQKLYVGF